MNRQTFRRMILLISFLPFPIIMWYFSPYLIISAACEYIINGSFIVFCCMFIGSMFFGRIWRGYLCPAGGLQECATIVKDSPAKQGHRDLIKFFIWVLMIVTVAIMFIIGKNDVTVDFFHMTDHGVPVTEICNYAIYYAVIFLFVVPPLICGRRASCHYICWMAPFMLTGGKLGKILHLPQLHIRADKDTCISCSGCNKKCPMGIDVKDMVQRGNMNNSECIL